MWYENGNKDTEYFYNPPGNETRMIMYHPNGQKWWECIYTNGTRITIGEWDEHGIPIKSSAEQVFAPYSSSAADSKR